MAVLTERQLVLGYFCSQQKYSVGNSHRAYSTVTLPSRARNHRVPTLAHHYAAEYRDNVRFDIITANPTSEKAAPAELPNRASNSELSQNARKGTTTITNQGRSCDFAEPITVSEVTLCFAGRQYENKEKALALTLYKTMGKRSYNCLRNVFQHIPSIQTLQLVLQKIPLAPGLNPLILRHLENISKKMTIKNKVCILIWDEVSIQSNVMYDVRRDIIYGYEDWGNNRTSKVADHALVFAWITYGVENANILQLLLENDKYSPTN
ncbi:uncharacterized protein LOC120357595 [Solenopsis invicta]|uniref:uncharacterized protein LOC120357595 n=1 Tax=Solenopsis invicta TaxID=13686 RepID=UPI00193EAA94|nr:uncharacterized protein LOC120357595 [Solenopsis invicta]